MRKIYILFAIVLMAISNVTAQDYSSQLTMGDTPQMNMLNPGYMPSSPFLTLPVPILGNLNLRVSNSFAVADVVENNKILLDKIPNDASFKFGLDLDIINLGFRVTPKDFVTVSMGIRASNDIMYPVGAFDLIQNNSIDRTKPFDIKTASAVSAYGEIVLGYTRKIDKNWSVGAKFKYLSGLASLRTNQSNFQVNKTVDSYTIKGDVDMTIGGYDLDSKEMGSLANSGMAVDLGVHYISYDKRWTAGASILNMGYINWDSGSLIKSVDPNNTYTFDGLGDLENMLNGGSSSVTDQITDDLLEAIELDTISSSFRETMPITIHLGGSYNVDRAGRHTVTGNYLQYIDTKKINDYSLTAGYTYSSKSKRFKAMTSLIHRKRVPLSVGFGLVASTNRFQFFIMNDINVKGYFAFDKFACFNFRMGMNFLLGKKNI